MLPTIILGIALLLSMTAFYDTLFKILNNIHHGSKDKVQLLYPIVAIIFWCIFYYLIH